MIWIKVGIWFVVMVQGLPSPGPAHEIKVKPDPAPVVHAWAPAPRAPVPPPPAPDPGGPIDWIAIAQCESGGDWSYNGPSGFDGGLQFLPSTWISAGGGRYAPFAWGASPALQIAIAQRWVGMVGCYWCSAGWPHCGRFG